MPSAPAVPVSSVPGRPRETFAAFASKLHLDRDAEHGACVSKQFGCQLGPVAKQHYNASCEREGISRAHRLEGSLGARSWSRRARSRPRGPCQDRTRVREVRRPSGSRLSYPCRWRTMARLPIRKVCPSALGCAWSPHRRKHFPHRGMVREDTRHGPSRYLPGTKAEQIEQIETKTVREGHRTAYADACSEYVHSVGEVIGWDRAEDATWSFAECSGGVASGRSFHGRPMAESNRKLRRET